MIVLLKKCIRFVILVIASIPTILINRKTVVRKSSSQRKMETVKINTINLQI